MLLLNEKQYRQPIMMVEFPKSIATNLNDKEFPKLWWLNLNDFGISVPGSTRKSGLIWNQNQFWNIYTLITNYYWIEANQQRSYMSQLRNDDHKHWIESLATAASPLSCRPIIWWSPQKFRYLIVSKLQNLIMSHNKFNE